MASISGPIARRRAIFAVVTSLVGAVHAEVLPSLTTDDPSVGFLERLDGIGGCRLPDRRPWPGEVVVACLDSALSVLEDSQDRNQAVTLRARLALRDSMSAGWGPRPAWETVREGRSDRLFLDLAADGHAETANDSGGGTSLVVGGRLRPKVEVLLGDRLALWSRTTQLTEVSNRARWTKQMDPGRGVYQTALFADQGEAGKARTVDALEGGIEAEVVGVRVRSGLFGTSWGSLPEPLMFSGHAEPFPLTEASTRIGPIEAVLLAGRLTADTYSQRRYLYGHRLRWVGSSWSFAWSEAVVSIQRDLEPLYLVPVLPIINSEHRLGDPDNRQMDFDASWRPTRNLELSAELFLDDLQNVLGFFSDGWGNKWALGLGVRARDLTGPRTLDRLQVSRVEPWTGGPSSSIQPGQPSNVPVHFGTSLGSASGPNSFSANWDRRQDLSERWSWSARAGLEWKGRDPGSSVLDRNWRDSSGTWVVAHPRKSWLAGDLDTRQVVATGAELRFWSSWRAVAEGGMEITDASGEREVLPLVSCRIHFRG